MATGGPVRSAVVNTGRVRGHPLVGSLPPSLALVGSGKPELGHDAHQHLALARAHAVGPAVGRVAGAPGPTGAGRLRPRTPRASPVRLVAARQEASQVREQQLAIRLDTLPLSPAEPGHRPVHPRARPVATMSVAVGVPSPTAAAVAVGGPGGGARVVGGPEQKVVVQPQVHVSPAVRVPLHAVAVRQSSVESRRVRSEHPLRPFGQPLEGKGELHEPVRVRRQHGLHELSVWG